MAAAGGSGSGRFGESTEMKAERIEKVFALALKAHKSTKKPYHVEKIGKSNPQEVIISFPASGTFKDWYSGRAFGEKEIDLSLFPSLKSIGINEAALVNDAFLQRFQDILANSALKNEVERATKNQYQIVFVGHSSGGPVAILATLWALEKDLTTKSQGGINIIPPLCVTFGSPLVGNHIFSHATRRENWSRYFMHYVMRYDIVPRILFAPLSSLDQSFEPASPFLDPKSMSESIFGEATEASGFHFAVMSNAATVTSHVACKLMGSTEATLETLANFIPLSPYRPFGTYIFCTATANGKEGKQIVIRNPDAILQLLFFSAQLSTEAEADQVSYRSLQEHHLMYGTELKKSFGMQNVVYLDQLEKLPLSEDSPAGGNIATINTALNDLGRSSKARLCLRAAAELEERRRANEDEMKKKVGSVEEKMKQLGKYRENWDQKVGYYDGFKVQEEPDDFQANVMRLQLAASWDEIMEKVRSYELPDEFEGKDEWVKLGTRFRQLVEPLDIANYYRHSRHLEAGPYMGKGRPKRYRYPQRWLEHAQRWPEEAKYSESCFWAEVEDLCNMSSDNNESSFEKVKDRVVQLEKQLKKWSDNGELGKDVFLEGSTLVKWWKALPTPHKQGSCIRSLIEA